MPVTVAAAAARPANAVVDRIPRGQLCAILAGVAVALALVWLAVRQAPRGGVRVPGRVTEDVPPFTPPAAAPVIGPGDHINGVRYSPHRYPVACGGEVTSLIWFGHRPLLLPHERDADWLQRPPSEVTL